MLRDILLQCWMQTVRAFAALLQGAIRQFEQRERDPGRCNPVTQLLIRADRRAAGDHSGLDVILNDGSAL
jgi:hypothetical protein